MLSINSKRFKDPHCVRNMSDVVVSGCNNIRVSQSSGSSMVIWYQSCPSKAELSPKHVEEVSVFFPVPMVGGVTKARAADMPRKPANETYFQTQQHKRSSRVRRMNPNGETFRKKMAPTCIQNNKLTSAALGTPSPRGSGSFL